MFRPACAYAQSDQSLCWSLEYFMTDKLLTEQHLEFLSLLRGCTDSSESIHVKMPHCWKSHASRAHLFLGNILHAFLCHTAPRFHGQKASTVTDHNIDEASGLCASHEHPGILYTHNDSGGNDHRIYAIEATTGMFYSFKPTLTIWANFQSISVSSVVGRQLSFAFIFYCFEHYVSKQWGPLSNAIFCGV